MKKDFWQSRWEAKQTAFHEGKPNALLVTQAHRFAPAARILVPLAGKAFDLVWLEEHGHEVVGVEFVQQAIDEFRVEHPSSTVKMVQGDMLAMTPENLGTFDAIYDRAALIALEPSTRARYIEVCKALLKPNGPTLLIAFAYDQSKTPGPPFSTDEQTVRELFAGRSIDVLETRSASVSPRMKEAGVDSIDESAYWIV
jgi:thiopurine S-methyltransferase